MHSGISGLAETAKKRGRGRPKGAKNKKTLVAEAAAKRAARAIFDRTTSVIEGQLLSPGFEPIPQDEDRFERYDAHATLVRIYQDTMMPVEARIRAASAAARFEKPAVSPAPMSKAVSKVDRATLDRELDEIRKNLQKAADQAHGVKSADQAQGVAA